MPEKSDKKHEHILFWDHFSATNCCKSYATELRAELEQESESDIVCIGFHLRQAFDTSSPSVGLSVIDECRLDEAEKIADENRKYGLQTLNHTLDTLYYRLNGNEKRQQKKLYITVDFLTENEICHALDRAPELNGPRIDNWIGARYCVRKGSFDSNDLKNIGDFASGKFANHPEGYRRVEELNKQCEVNKTSFLLNDYICGAEKLCGDLEIDHSLSIYRVIAAAIYQLGRYACKDNGVEARFGSQTTTFLIRPIGPFSVVIGVTLIAQSISQNTISLVMNFLERKSNLLNSVSPCNLNILFGDFAQPHDLWGSSQGRHYRSRHQSAITNRLCQMLLDLDDSSNPINEDGWPVSLKNTLDAFLYITHRFCGERLEGHYMCFGFILGNQGLLTHTPREHPIPLTYTLDNKTYKLFTITELMEQVHLVSMPSERAIVIPYYQPKSGTAHDPKLATFLLEFDESMEEFRARPWAPLWNDQFIPYLFYTERFPWAVATYAGPGADFRVFAKGELVAYHSEKGWHEINRTEFVDHLNTKAGMEESVACCIVDISLQMSRFANPQAKGGLLIYLAANEDTSSSLNLVDYFTPLNTNEPIRVNGKRWLTGSFLINRLEVKSQPELDYSVARTLLQASLLDGAIVLQGIKDDENKITSVEVKLFSQRVSVKNDKLSSKGPESGTKRAAAKALMSDTNVPEGSVAIAISSDGPIRTWVKSKNKKHNDEPMECGILKSED